MSWTDGILTEIDLRRQSIDPSSFKGVRVEVANRSALSRVGPMAPTYKFSQEALDAYDSARLKLAGAVAAKKGLIVSADEWRSLIAWQAIGGAVLARDNSVRFVPERDADVREAKAKGGAKALPDPTHGLFVVDARGLTHRDPTVAKGLAASRGAIDLLSRAPKTGGEKGSEYVKDLSWRVTGGGVEGASSSRYAVPVLGDGSQLPNGVALGGWPDFQQNNPAVAAVIVGGAVVLGLGSYGIWSWSEVAEKRIEAEHAPMIAASNGLVSALYAEIAAAEKEGRPVNPNLLAGVQKIATLPADSLEWKAPLGTLAAGAALAVGAGWVFRRLAGRRVR